MSETEGYKPILISTIVDTPAGKRIFKGYKPILISTIVDASMVVSCMQRL